MEISTTLWTKTYISRQRDINRHRERETHAFQQKENESEAREREKATCMNLDIVEIQRKVIETVVIRQGKQAKSESNEEKERNVLDH